MSDISPLESDALVQAKEFLLNLESKLADHNIASLESLIGFNPLLAAQGYLKQYDNGNSFMKDMQSKLRSGQPLSVPMQRAVLNILRDEVRGVAKPVDPNASRSYTCFGCNELIIGREALYKHREQECPKRWVRCEHCDRRMQADQLPCDCQTLDPAITAGLTDLDISMLVGRFAFPNPRAHEPEQDSFLYFAGWRRIKEGKRDRQYVYGKFRKRTETIPAGTIEIKWQRGDTKKLVGEQRPGETYRGEFVEELRSIAENPEVWARLYGLQLHKCGRCGKSLTDDESKAFGFGPDCIEIMNVHGWGWYDKNEPQPDDDDDKSSTGGGFTT